MGTNNHLPEKCTEENTQKLGGLFITTSSETSAGCPKILWYNSLSTG
jgi:hypothetical protein